MYVPFVGEQARGHQWSLYYLTVGSPSSLLSDAPSCQWAGLGQELVCWALPRVEDLQQAVTT